MPELAQLDRTPRAKGPTTSPSSGGNAVIEQPRGNSAAQDDITVSPMGRVFNRILGQPDNGAITATMAFDKNQLQAYLDRRIQLAEGEFFRGKKLEGVADALLEQLDTDKNGKVSWAEFSVFEMQTLETMAPGLKPGASSEQVKAAAGSRFNALDTGEKDGKLNYTELETGTRDALPKDTDHKDLVAQLGARIALDAVDTDQQKSPVKDRTLGRGEWTDAAVAMASRRKN